MRFLSSAVAAFAVMYHMAPAQGYLIDTDSCTGANYQLAKSLVQEAFTMANLASSAVKTDPIDQNAAWLMQKLFNVEGSAAKALIKEVFNVGKTNNKDETPGILVFENEVTGSAESLTNVNEVVIFCDESRLAQIANDRLHLFDTKLGEVVSSSKDCAGIDFMYTQTFPKRWDLIQICPWFLKYASAKKYKTKADLTSLRASLAVMGLDKLITKQKYTPIDLASLWDKAMLHEMMHTKAGGLKIDVDKTRGYGWKNCKALANGGRGIMNADSWALFGSALYWFSQGSPIDENGKFL